MEVFLVGNPNCGKTTLFNALTGANQRIGNWPGVTVEKKMGLFEIQNHPISLIDLPGIYSLAIHQGEGSLDEEITVSAIATLSMDLIINVIDACQLERHLYLSSQLLELGKPLIIAVNMTDIAEDQGIILDLPTLSKKMGCPVVAIQAHKRIGLEQLKRDILKPTLKPHALKLNLPPSIDILFEEFKNKIQKDYQLSSEEAYFLALRAFEGDTFLRQGELSMAVNLFSEKKDLDILFASSRYENIHALVLEVQKKQSDSSEYFTAKMDKIILNRYLGLPIFLLVMYLMFFIAINIGGAFQDFFDIATDTLFVQAPAVILVKLQAPHWLIALIAYGIGKGINTILTFVPVIAAMFFCLSFLEASGYMARAAFVVDKLMRVLGLPGKSFVPLIVGFGCNVPAIMSSRIMDAKRDRYLTVLMAPFMSCSARLAIYAVFVAAFFPSGGQNVVFALYLIGIGMAILTGFFLRKTMLKGQTSPLILDLPPYHKPLIKRLCRDSYFRLSAFVSRAKRVVIPVCIVLGGLNALTFDFGLSAGSGSSQSLLSVLGQSLTPLFSPMGLTVDNWPATVGLFTGMLAKEVVIGSMNALYSQSSSLGFVAPSITFDFWAAIGQAFWTIPENLSHLGQAMMNPFAATIPDTAMSESLYGVMSSRFDGKAGAFAYMLFILLYIPCISTMAAIRQETNKQLMWFSMAWSLILAYVMAVVFYQMATFGLHPYVSFFWLGFMGLIVLVFFLIFSFWGNRLEKSYACANS